MRITYFKSDRDKSTDDFDDLEWEDIVDKLTRHDERCDKAGPGFALVKFADICHCGRGACSGIRGHATVENVLEIHALCFDLDKGFSQEPLSKDGAIDYLKNIYELDITAVAYTTHSSTSENPAWRLVVPLASPISSKEFKGVWFATLKYLDIPSGIKTDNPARFWYLPSCKVGKDRQYVAFPSDRMLDVEKHLCIAPELDLISSEAVVVKTDFPKASEKLLKYVAQRLHVLGQANAGENGSMTTFIAANMLLNDYALSWDEAWPMFRAWNTSNTPPWDEVELRERLNINYATEPYGEARHVKEFTDRLGGLEKPVEAGTFAYDLVQARLALKSELNLDHTDTDSSEMFVRATDLIAKDYPKTPWLVSGIATQGGVGVIGGEPKTFKTWLGTEIAIAVASGDKVCGEFLTMQGAVAYFYAEDMAISVRNRINSLCHNRDKVPSELYCQPRGRDLDICNDESLAVLLASAGKIPNLKLLVLDPFRDIHTAAEDSSDEMAKVMRRLRVLGTLLDCTILFIHHTAKAGADTSARRPGQRLRGSSAVHGGTDNGIYLSGSSGDGRTEFTNSIFSEVKGALGAGHFSLTLKIKDGVDGTAVKADWKISKGEDMGEELNDLISAIGNCIMRGTLRPTTKEIHEIIKGTKQGVKALLNIAKSQGYIRRCQLEGVFRGWEFTEKGQKFYDVLT